MAEGPKISPIKSPITQSQALTLCKKNILHSFHFAQSVKNRSARHTFFCCLTGVWSHSCHLLKCNCSGFKSKVFKQFKSLVLKSTVLQAYTNCVQYFFLQYLVSLLVASDMEVVLSALGVLYVFRYFLNLSILHVDETKGSIEIVEVTTSWQYKTRSVQSQGIRVQGLGWGGWGGRVGAFFKIIYHFVVGLAIYTCKLFPWCLLYSLSSIVKDLALYHGYLLRKGKQFNSVFNAQER